PLSALSYTAPAPNVIYPLSLHDALPICCSLRTHTVRLHPNRVGAEEERAPAIVERVQVQKDVVFVPDVVPVCTRCANRLRLAVVDRKSTRLNSSHVKISYAVFCLKKKTG